MEYNTPMENLFFKRKIYASYNISLLGKVNIDFKEKFNCYFLKQFIKNARHSEYYFSDHIGYEAWLNAFHVDYYIKSYYEQASFTYIINAIAFWKKRIHEKIFGSVASYFSLGRKDVYVRLFVKRENEDGYYLPDLNSYTSPILLASSDDVNANPVISPRKWLPPWDLLTEDTKSKILQDAARFA